MHVDHFNRILSANGYVATRSGAVYLVAYEDTPLDSVAAVPVTELEIMSEKDVEFMLSKMHDV